MTARKQHLRPRTAPASRRPPEQILARLIEMRFADLHRPALIAIGGPGGTGKSTFADHLATLLNDACILSLDHYKTPRHDRAAAGISGPHPDANRLALVHEHLLALRSGHTIDQPIYNPKTGTADSTCRFEPNQVTIVEGEIATYKQFRHLFDLSIFIDSDWKTQLTTRISRDIEARQHSREKVITTFLQSNLREFEQYGAQSKTWADVHLYCSDDYRLRLESVTTTLYEQLHDVLDQTFSPIQITGLIVPVCTPFDDTGRIDQRLFIAHLEYLAEHGVSRIAVGGTTGEFYSLTDDERRTILSLARRYFPGMVICHVTATSMQQTLALARHSQHDGADALLALPPIYPANLPNASLIDWFTQICQATDLPVIAYNFTQHTGNRLTGELLNDLPIFGLKDSDADTTLIPAVSHYFIGNDCMIHQADEQGGTGFFSGIANALPLPYIRIEQAMTHRDRQQVIDLQQTISRIAETMTGPSQIGLIKHLLAEQLPGYPTTVRSPTAMPNTGQIQQTRHALQAMA